jgi:hypothetical protein
VTNKLFLIFFFVPFLCLGQQVNTANENFRIDEIVFNEDFMKLNGIKSIKATNTTKSDGEPLKMGKEYYFWQFDTEGRVIGESKTLVNVKTNMVDTLHFIMRYNRNQRLTYRTERVGKRIKSFHYKYNSDGELLQTDMKERWNFSQRPDFINSVDSFSYQTITDTSYIKLTYNGDGASYREQLYVCDTENRIVERNGRYLRGDIRTKMVFDYDLKGNLKEKVIYYDIHNDLSEKYKLFYDSLGNISKLKSYKNNENKKIIDYIYFEDSILLKAIINQDVSSHDLNILKFEYEYFIPESLTR